MWRSQWENLIISIVRKVLLSMGPNSISRCRSRHEADLAVYMLSTMSGSWDKCGLHCHYTLNYSMKGIIYIAEHQIELKNRASKAFTDKTINESTSTLCVHNTFRQVEIPVLFHPETFLQLELHQPYLQHRASLGWILEWKQKTWK